jgi:hypothetical protein
MRSRVYLAFAVLGFITPLVLINVYGIDHGYNIGDMISAMWPNPIALAVLCDLSLSIFVFWYWAAQEGPKHGIDHWWWIIPLSVLVGLCFALPLFLYWRERALESAAA